MFEITRSDGRSNQAVLIDAVKDREPGSMFTYDKLAELLGFDEVPRIRQVVLNAQHRLLSEYQRTMRNVRGVGYRLAEASEHCGIANDRRHRARRQMRKGLMVLQNVRWEEMSEDQRQAHQGQLMLTSSVFQMVDALQRRQDRQEAVLSKLTSRVDEVEQQTQ